jgi:glycosyltransferase involved in cell wall biosynthesis
MSNITALIITLNEEMHLERCINNIKDLVSDIVIIDSFSNDKTIQIAAKLNIKLIQNKFINHAQQFNFGLSQLSKDAKWVLKIDADEILTKELIAEIKEKLPKLDKDINGVYIKRRLFFQNKIIKYGRLSPVKLLRLFRFQKGFSDNRWVDEKIIIEGKSSIFNEYMIDYNLKSINYWIQKHNQYSSNEALNFLLLKYNSFFDKTIKFKEYFNSTNQVNLIKRNIYLKLPLIIRAFVIFFFRYFFCLGFLNGKSGIIYYFLRFLWYPLLVDIKIIEVKILLKNNIKIEEAIKKILQIDIDNV